MSAATKRRAGIGLGMLGFALAILGFILLVAGETPIGITNLGAGLVFSIAGVALARKKTSAERSMGGIRPSGEGGSGRA